MSNEKQTLKELSVIYRKIKDRINLKWIDFIKKINREKIINKYEKVTKQEIKKTMENVVKKDEKLKIEITDKKQLKNVLIEIKNKYVDNRLVMRLPDGSTSYLLNEQTVEKLIDDIDGKSITEKYIPDTIENMEGDLIIENYKSEQTTNKKKLKGGFFPYLHNTQHDFSKYQLFNTFDKKNYKNNCLYISLKNYDDITPTQLNVIKTTVKDRKINKCDLTKIAKLMNITIKLISLKNKKKQRTKIYNKGNKEYKIAYFNEHYFTYEKFENIFIENKKIRNSLHLFRYLYEDREILLTVIPNTQLNEIGYNCDDIDDLNYDKEQILKKNQPKEKTNEEYGNIYFCDFECYAEQNKHYAYQLGFESYKENDYVCFNDELYGEKCGLNKCLSCKMLNFICRRNTNKNKIILYFHNLKYDSCFFDYDKVHNLEILKNNEVLYKINFDYYLYNKKFKFELRDTYKHLSYPLNQFSELFELNEELKQKEIMPYNFYTKENVIKRFCKIQDACDSLKRYKYECSEEDIKHFKDNIKKWDLTASNKNKFDIITYSKKYNMLDVKILKQGFIQWRERVLDFAKLDIFNILTSASLAQKYFEKNGAYTNNIYKINQMARKFIHKSVFGGRCMTNRNKKYLINNKMQDFDAVSLYPSAIYRLIEQGGILKGLPKILSDEQLNMNFLNKCDGYFVEIRVREIKRRDFPLIPIKRKGELLYSNKKLINKTMIINKIQLEDLINFCNCKFDLIRGYYFDEGRDKTICEIILNLFKTRIEYKKNKNPLQEVIKLLMNSAYGKTIQKESDTELKIFTNNKCEKFVNYNYNDIKTIKKIGDSDKYIIEKYVNVQNHYGMPHIGSEILAMSKRIMNEVMCLAEDNNIKIYYQDTDSMHMMEEDVEKIGKLFNDKYGRELIGTNMGQFHCDFSSKKIKGDLSSKQCILLGKKAYLHVLTNAQGETDYYARLKGIPNQSIKKKCDDMKIDMYEIYKKLYNGEKISFDLTCEQQKPKFEIKNFITETKMHFDREIRF